MPPVERPPVLLWRVFRRPPAPKTSLLGVIAGGSGATGTITIDIAADNALTPLPSTYSPVSASGVWTQGGAAVALTGTFDPLTKSLSLAGVRGVTTYTFASSATEQTAIDMLGGMNGASTMGVFAAFVRRPGVSVTAQCGDGVGVSLGKFGLVFTSDGRAAMVLFGNTIPQYFRPSLDGRDLTNTGFLNITGTIDSSGASANGTFSQSSITGTWSTATNGC